MGRARAVVWCLGVSTALAALGGSTAAAAAEQLPPDTIAARGKFFGAENVDRTTGALRRDRLILSWFGVTNFAMAIDGQVVLLDAWVPRGAHSGYIPTTPDEVAKLRPKLIFLGHAHFDHAGDVAEIATKSGAAVVGTAEHCDQTRRQAGAAAMVRCVVVAAPGAPPGTQRTLDDLLPGIDLTAIKHLHSSQRAPDGQGLHVPVTPPPNPQTVVENPPTPQSFASLVGSLPDAEGGSVLYQFGVRGFRFTYNDTVGPLKEDAPQVLDLLRRLPPSDLQVSSIQGFNQFTNGMRDVRMYAEALRPKLFVPSHHDDWAPGVTTKGERYEPYLRDELGQIPAERRPSLRFIYDPYDYLRPSILTFELPPTPVAGLPAPGSPAGRECRSRRRFRIRIREPHRGRVTRATVYVNGRRVKVVRGRRLRAPIDLRGLPRGRFTVRVVGRTSTGRTISETRRYVTCVPAARAASNAETTYSIR